MNSRSPLTAFRLDAGIALAHASPSHSSPVDLESPAWEVVTDLTRRVQVLEESGARRERVFQRLMDVFSGFNAQRQ